VVTDFKVNDKVLVLISGFPIGVDVDSANVLIPGTVVGVSGREDACILILIPGCTYPIDIHQSSVYRPSILESFRRSKRDGDLVRGTRPRLSQLLALVHQQAQQLNKSNVWLTRVIDNLGYGWDFGNAVLAADSEEDFVGHLTSMSDNT